MSTRLANVSSIRVGPSRSGAAIGKRPRPVGWLRRPEAYRCFRELRRLLMGSRLNLLSVGIIAIVFILAILGDVLAPHDPTAPDIAAKFRPPSWQHVVAADAPRHPGKLLRALGNGETWRHPMGTDNLGRDIMSRVMAGTSISLQVAAVVLAFAVAFGTLVGAIAGYAGGLVDEILMRITDLFLAFPALVLAIAVAATLGRDLRNAMIALSTVFWPWYARLVRAQVLSIKERDFVTAARSLGATPSRLLLRHVLPNAVSVVIIQVTLDVGYAVLATSSLSFIGLGAQPPSPEWGTMLAEARSHFREAWWYFTFPGVALALTIFAFNVLGDALQEALDPRLARR